MMAPFLSSMNIHPPKGLVLGKLISRDLTSISELKLQWNNPSDILSLLLLLGPDVIQRALAQLVGRRVTPVAFSFGWAAYSISALFSAIGGMYLVANRNIDNANLQYQISG